MIIGNPRRRRRRRTARAASGQFLPAGNPRRRRRRRATSRRRHNPVNPRVMRVARRRHYRRNPAPAFLKGLPIMETGVMAAGVILSDKAVQVVERFVPQVSTVPFIRPAIKLGAVIALRPLAHRFIGGRFTRPLLDGLLLGAWLDVLKQVLPASFLSDYVTLNGLGYMGDSILNPDGLDTTAVPVTSDCNMTGIGDVGERVNTPWSVPAWQQG